MKNRSQYVSLDKDWDKWLDTFIEEKGIDTEREFEKDIGFGTNYIPVWAVLDAMKATTIREQRKIKETLIKIDFNNGDLYRYFNHLAVALC